MVINLIKLLAVYLYVKIIPMNKSYHLNITKAKINICYIHSTTPLLTTDNLGPFFFFFGCVVSSLLRTGFLQLWRVGSTLRYGAQASHCGGFSCCRARALGARASVVVAHRLSSCGSRTLEHRLSSCGARAELLRGMWDLPGPGIEPVSPALAGGFSTTAPPGKSQGMKPHLIQKIEKSLKEGPSFLLEYVIFNLSSDSNLLQSRRILKSLLITEI